MAWKKGQSGNQNGQGKDKLFRTALLMELKSRGEDMPELRKIARKAIDQALDGDNSARNMIIERLDGKVPQAVADDEGPVTVIIEHIACSRPSVSDVAAAAD